MDKNEFAPSLSTLNSKQQLAFALLLFDRMLPPMTAFSKDTGFDSSCYLKARDTAWKVLENRVLDRNLMEVCLRAAPDTEEYSHPLTSYALNAALAMADILQFALDGNKDGIANIVTLAQDSVHLYLAALNPAVVSSPDRDRWIAHHPLLQQELRQEEEDIKFLRQLPEQFDAKTVSILRVRAAKQSPLLPLPTISASPAEQR